MASKKDPYMKYFEMPKGILNQISEASPEGYLLFYIDNYGKIQIRADFLHEVTEVGLRARALKILQSIDEVEGTGITEGIYRKMTDESEEDY